jgi:sugar phosphate isomerase/epimerase
MMCRSDGRKSTPKASADSIDRREFSIRLAAAAGVSLLPNAALSSQATRFEPKYILGSCLYGYTDLAAILPQAQRVGAVAIDIWPKVHGNQREQLDELGETKFVELLQEHQLKLGCITQYPLGPFGLQEEMRLAHRLGCHTLVTGGQGPVGLTGTALKSAVKAFAEQMKPHLEVAEQTGVTVAIENHANNLIDSPDSLKWLVEFRSSTNLGVAFAPYHLPQDEALMVDLIRTLGSGIEMFYFWQHGKGCMTKLPKEQELLQMPGRGDLDFAPLVAALADIGYSGWSEIFMHPVPRGIPILDSTSAVTEEIDRARKYLQAIAAAS